MILLQNNCGAGLWPSSLPSCLQLIFKQEYSKLGVKLTIHLDEAQISNAWHYSPCTFLCFQFPVDV